MTTPTAEERGPLVAKPAETKRPPPQPSLLLADVPRWATSQRWMLLMLALSCAIEAFCYTLCVPFMTTHLHAKYKASVSQSALIFVAYTIGSVTSTPFVEGITRRFGCSGAISLGLLTLGLSQLAFMVAPQLSLLFGARFVGGFAAGVIWSAVLTACHLISLSSQNMGTLFGTVLSAVSIGTMAGPAAGGVLYRFGGWYVPFVLVGLVCCAAASVVATLLLELMHAQPAGAHSKPASSLCDACDRQLLLVLMIVMSGAMLFASIDSVLPIHLEHVFESTSLHTASVFFTISVFYGLGGPTFGSLADRTGRALHVSLGGLLCLALLLPVVASVRSHWALYAAAALYGASGTAQLTPASTLLEQVADVALGSHPTLTYALFNCAYVSGMAIGPGALATLTDVFSDGDAAQPTKGFALASVVLALLTSALALSAAVGLSLSSSAVAGGPLQGARRDSSAEESDAGADNEALRTRST